MQTTTVHAILDKEIDSTLGHLIYVVRDGSLVFYVGQSKRDVVARFGEHLLKPSRLGELIELNRPQSFDWAVDFYTLADCRPFVTQKSLFAMQAWEHFDMDMAEQNLIAALRPVLNRDFNPQPSPLPPHYQGRQLTGQPATAVSPGERVWLNQMSLAGWVYETDANGRTTWQHHDGRTLSEQQVTPYRQQNRIP
ncbi:MAG TPA: hypothetical protein PLD25_16455 [Chloroflexota bacterium]|nr:hypothetical protein [Chloroflexota bacterium]